MREIRKFQSANPVVLTLINGGLNIIQKFEELPHLPIQIDEDEKAENCRSGQKQSIGDFHDIPCTANQKPNIANDAEAIYQKARRISCIEWMLLNRLIRTHADYLQIAAD